MQTFKKTKISRRAYLTKLSLAFSQTSIIRKNLRISYGFGIYSNPIKVFTAKTYFPKKATLENTFTPKMPQKFGFLPEKL